ncbi:MAG: tetrahydromethanopterin S-methyltransferase subunit A, partial [Euryarchaeota archaeon]|nr:tetrahydromethanopterin S-methyltransferase subunit A [Euryarchaeota archaeon]
ESLTATIRKKASTIEMLKVSPVADYPTEEGCFLRGNHYSPVAVVVMLNAPYGTMPPEVKSIPPEIDKLVRLAVETGAALSGTLQTENIGIEKIVCNIVGNPNIRHIVLCGIDVEGHHSGDAIRALIENGVNEWRTIIGSTAVTPYLFNIPKESIERFRKQLTLINLLGEMNPEVITKAVWSCYQEKPTPFLNYTLSDPGAYPEQPMSCRLSWRVKQPESIEEWELKDLVKGIEEEEKAVAVPQQKEVAVKVSEPKVAAIASCLSRIAEELSQIAKILVEEKPIVPVKEAPVVEEAKPVCVVKEETPAAVAPAVVELTEKELYFHNQLRAYPGILAGLSACDKDMCHNGCSLPAAVTSITKKLAKLKKDIEGASISKKKREEFLARIDGFLEAAEGLPTEPGQPCQKTLGNCTIGKGCLATGAADLLKQITEPASLMQ